MSAAATWMTRGTGMPYAKVSLNAMVWAISTAGRASGEVERERRRLGRTGRDVRRGSRVVWGHAARRREPAKVSIVTLTAASTHTATAAAAIAIPGLARMPLQLTCLIARESRANQIRSARRTTRRRYATASSAVEVHRRRTCSRSSCGSGASGSRRENAAGRIAPQPRRAQVWHSPMCQTTRSRVCSVSCPSQSASNSPSTGQASRPVSAMCSAPRASSSRPSGARGQVVCPAL